MADQVTIQLKENGPILAPGNATYKDAHGQEQTTPGSMVALCRCGGSGNKPFCDGSHGKIGFTAPAVELIFKKE
jgi:CDGSH-type Zn-finger protein